MKHYTYIIFSSKYDKFYRGYSSQPFLRLKQHNNGESKYTRNFTPWEIVCIQEFSSKIEAMKREKALKKYSKNQIKLLINSSKNLLNTNRY